MGNSPRRSTNEIVKAFVQTNLSEIPQFVFYRTRSVKPISPRMAQASPQKYTVEPLIVADQRCCWSEKRLDSDPVALAADHRNDREAIRESLQSQPILAVTVTEQDDMAQTPRSQPVMLVFGDASWIGNALQRNEDNVSLLSSCLSWLRGKPDLGRKPSDYTKTRDKYELKLQPTELRRLLLLPGLLLLVSVVVLGGGVWVVRRR